MYKLKWTSCIKHKYYIVSVRFPFEEMKYWILSFPCSGNEAKAWRWVQPLNTQCIRNSEVGNGSILIRTECLTTRYPGSLCLPCAILYVNNINTNIIYNLNNIQIILNNHTDHLEATIKMGPLSIHIISHYIECYTDKSSLAVNNMFTRDYSL